MANPSAWFIKSVQYSQMPFNIDYQWCVDYLVSVRLRVSQHNVTVTDGVNISNFLSQNEPSLAQLSQP